MQGNLHVKVKLISNSSLTIETACSISLNYRNAQIKIKNINLYSVIIAPHDLTFFLSYLENCKQFIVYKRFANCNLLEVNIFKQLQNCARRCPQLTGKGPIHHIACYFHFT